MLMKPFIYAMLRMQRRFVSTSPLSYLKGILRDSLGEMEPSILKKGEVDKICSVYRKGDHYQSALPFNRDLVKDSDPITIANRLIKHMPENEAIANATVVAKGFLAFELNPNWIAKCIPGVVEKSWRKTSDKRALVDYVSPNMAKEMHVGHLRSIVQGEFISRILERVGGYQVERVSHVGDFGTPLGNIIAHCMDMEQSFESKDLYTPQQLTELYVQASKRAKEDPNFPSKGLKATLSLQSGSDSSIQAKWKRICEISREGFRENEKWFDVDPIERGESFYKDKLPFVISSLEEKKLAVESDGAQCVFVPMGKKEVPYIVQKKDKSFLYATTDLAALYHRTQELQMDRIVYLTDTAQRLHFQQLFYIANKLGWLNLPNGNRVEVEHAYFGAVLGADGTRMRSREGAPIKLKEFIEQAETKAAEALAQSSFNSGKTDIKRVAQAAIKYYELSNQRTQDYKFSFDHMMQFHGSTGVYLLYAYSRVVSILEKHSGESFNDQLLVTDSSVSYTFAHPDEIALASHLIYFWDILDHSLASLSSNGLSDYLFVLSSKFNKFYEHCPVLRAENLTTRIELCKATAIVLLKGFEILNITPTRL